MKRQRLQLFTLFLVLLLAPVVIAQEFIDEQLLEEAKADILATLEMSEEERKTFQQGRLERLNALPRDERLARQRARKAARLQLSDVIAERSLSRKPRAADAARPTVDPSQRINSGVGATRIQYDSGTRTLGVGRDSSRMLGNRFDTVLGSPVQSTGQITFISFDMLRTSFDQVVWSLYSDIMGTTARQVTSKTIPAAPGINTWTVMSSNTANAYRNGPFLAGIFQLNTAFTRLAVDSNSTQGQGFHGITLNDGNPGTMLADGTAMRSNVNMVFRVHITDVTPVELLDFKVK